MPLWTDALTPGLMSKGQAVKPSVPHQLHPSRNARGGGGGRGVRRRVVAGPQVGTEVTGMTNGDPSSAVPGTLKITHPTPSSPRLPDHTLSNLCSKPTQTLQQMTKLKKTKKNNKTEKKKTTCHGVFHQLPTRGSYCDRFPRGTQPTKPQTWAHFVSRLVLFIPPCPHEQTRVQWSERQPTELPGCSEKGAGLLDVRHGVRWRRTQLATDAENFCLFSLEIW